MPDGSFRTIAAGVVAAHTGAVITTEAALCAICACLRRTYGKRRHAAKSLARDVSAPSAESARNWLKGKSLPQTATLLEMCRTNPDMWKTVCELTGHAEEAHQVTPTQWQRIQDFLHAFHPHFAGLSLAQAGGL